MSAAKNQMKVDSTEKAKFKTIKQYTVETLEVMNLYMKTAILIKIRLLEITIFQISIIVLTVKLTHITIIKSYSLQFNLIIFH